MEIKKRIDIGKYFGLSSIHIGLTYFGINNWDEYKIILLVFFATVLNQWMLIESVDDLVSGAAGKNQSDSSFSVVMFLGKTLILLAALSFGVHIMGKRIIIPLLNYIVQIFILYFSFRRKDSEQ
jgi:hypothetical protein